MKLRRTRFNRIIVLLFSRRTIFLTVLFLLLIWYFIVIKITTSSAFWTFSRYFGNNFPLFRPDEVETLIIIYIVNLFEVIQINL